MSRLVLKPSVHAIASTTFTLAGITDWAREEGLMPIMNRDGAPLASMYDAISTESVGDFRDTSLDRLAEFAGRHCYRSWEKGREIGPYMENIIESAHGSVLRHGTVVLAISGISRTLSLELIRHHVGADVSQESQRYVEADDIRFVVPPLMLRAGEKMTEQARKFMLDDFEVGCLRDVADYEILKTRLSSYFETDSTIDKKRALEAARARLPNCAETRLVWTMNMNSMRNIVAARGSVHADLEIRRLAVEFCRIGKRMAPHIFEDFRVVTADDGFEAVLTPYPKL